MDSNSVQILVQSPLTDILSVISLVCLWKIFTDRGEAGWKALIPFYNEYILGKTCNEEELGLKSALASAIAVLLAIPLLVLALMSSDGGVNPLITMGAMLLEGIIGLAAVVFGVQLRYRFCVFNDAQSWIAIVWVLLSPIAHIYFAFIHKNYDIPGITEKEEK